jgi:hypothetical protein
MIKLKSGGSNSQRRGILPLAIPLAVTVVSVAVYVHTLAPEVDWSDSAELCLQAYQLGVTHPTGYPIHTFLGRLFILVFQDPATATNLLSAVSTGLAAGILSLTTMRVTSNWFASAAAGLSFASAPQIWGWAVVTEVYGVNALVLSLTLLTLLSWYQNPSPRLFYATALMLGLSLATYLANVPILPALVLLVLASHSRFKLSRSALFVGLMGAVALLILSWSYIRSHTMPPLGTRYIPDTLRGFVLYLTGAQYETSQIPTPGFFVERLSEHTLRFCEEFYWVGIVVGVVGLIQLTRSHRPIGIAFLAAFAMDMVFFTGYGSTDYYTMVTPSYILFSIWIGYGIHLLSRETLKPLRWFITAGRVTFVAAGASIISLGLVADLLGIGQKGFGTTQILLVVMGSAVAAIGFFPQTTIPLHWLEVHRGEIIAVAAAVVIVAGQVTSQLEMRIERSRRAYVSEYVWASFEVLPANAIAISSWDKFAPLMFFQRTQGLRQDITLVERTLWSEVRPRTYDFGTIDDWRQYAREQSTSNQVFLDTDEEPIGGTYRLEDVYHGWYLVIPVSH